MMSTSTTLFINWTTTQLPKLIDEDDEGISRNKGVTYFFYFYYSFIFILGFFGNIMIIASVLKFRKMRTVFNVFLVNLAFADILFVLLSLFHLVKFLYKNEWIFGEVFCKIQVTFIETSYTVSICTLTVVAAERYLTICNPHRIKRTASQAAKVCGLLWIFSFLFCSCLLYGAGSKINEDGKLGCSNDSWTDHSRLIFYSVHTVLVYLVPLGMMCFSHYHISKVLIHQKKKIESKKMNVNLSINSINQNTVSPRDQRKALETARRIRVIRLLVVVTLVFFILWTPFIIVRFFKYSGVEISDLLWRGMQLLIMGNTAANCLIYAFMNREFRECFKSICCCQEKDHFHNKAPLSISNSCEMSENLRVTNFNAKRL